MSDLQTLKSQILANGVIDDAEVELIRDRLAAGGGVGRREVEFLIELRNQAQAYNKAFEDVFFDAVRRNVLTDGSIDAEEVRWLRYLVFADGAVDEREKKFLRQLRSEARACGPEFQALYDECMM